MEKAQKGRSLGSADEFREGRKKKGMPLAVFLSFNDRDVHPHCPNASNPYHKCGRHCLDRIPSGNLPLNRDRSGGSSSEGEVLERKGVNPNCPKASNPYHKCADYCFEKMTEKSGDAGKVADRSDVHPNCKYAHNPYHKCNHLCFDNRPVMDHVDGVIKSKEPNSGGSAGRRVNPECKNASNPFHVCAEYCFQGIPERAKLGHGTKPEKPKESGNIMSNADERRVNPNCRHASNPHHRCAESCFQNVPEDMPRAVPNKEIKGRPRIERREYPSKETSMESEHAEASTSSNDGDDSFKIINKNVGTDESEPVLTTKEKEMELSALELSDMQPLRIDAIDLFKEWAKYCSLKASDENEAKEDITRQRI